MAAAVTSEVGICDTSHHSEYGVLHAGIEMNGIVYAVRGGEDVASHCNKGVGHGHGHCAAHVRARIGIACALLWAVGLFWWGGGQVVISDVSKDFGAGVAQVEDYGTGFHGVYGRAVD